jgi:hypothetical protein
MPRKSTKVVNADVSTSEIAPASAPANSTISYPDPDPNPDTKKKAPVKRVSKKINVANTSDNDKNKEKDNLPTTTANNQTATQPSSIQVSDSVNTFNIHIKHVSDDGSNIENTFSTTYTHTSRDSDDDDHDHDDDHDDDSSDNNSNSDSDRDSDYDTKFKNSSLSLPISSSTDMNSLLALASAVSALSEDENPLYTTQQINYDILIPFVLINMHASSRENILALLHTTLISCIEGRCITEGYIKPHSTRIIDFKCGKIIAKNVQFNIVIECLVCNPPTNSIISCVAKNITQAGIRAVSDDEYSPVVVYITRDFGIDSDKTYYNSIKEGDKINIKVIGKRFEMNDKHIQIIGFLAQPKKERSSLTTSHSKKLQSLHSSALSTESAESSCVSGGRAKVSQTRGPRKTKNPLSITNDTDNNVITITYDPTIDLPSEPKTKAPKEPKTKAPKEPKTKTKTKTPKEPKTPKKENVASASAVVTSVTTNE